MYDIRQTNIGFTIISMLVVVFVISLVALFVLRTVTTTVPILAESWQQTVNSFDENTLKLGLRDKITNNIIDGETFVDSPQYQLQLISIENIAGSRDEKACYQLVIKGRNRQKQRISYLVDIISRKKSNTATLHQLVWQKKD